MINQSNFLLQQALQYKSCTPQRKCLQCENDFICKKCTENQSCCPKRCLSCHNDTYCTKCQLEFQLITLSQKSWRICANNQSQIDYHRIQTVSSFSSSSSSRSSNSYNRSPYESYGVKQTPKWISTKCQKGYFFQSNIKFGQKCMVENCETCLDSIHCIICQKGFFPFNGLCITWDDVKLTFDQANKYQQVDNTTKESKEVEAQVKEQVEVQVQDQRPIYLWFLIIGLFLGICLCIFFSLQNLACILILIWSCIKRNCNKFSKKFFTNVDQKDLIINQSSINSQLDVVQNSNRKNSIGQKNQTHQNDCSQNNRQTNRSAITQE